MTIQEYLSEQMRNNNYQYCYLVVEKQSGRNRFAMMLTSPIGLDGKNLNGGDYVVFDGFDNNYNVVDYAPVEAYFQYEIGNYYLNYGNYNPYQNSNQREQNNINNVPQQNQYYERQQNAPIQKDKTNIQQNQPDRLNKQYRKTQSKQANNNIVHNALNSSISDEELKEITGNLVHNGEIQITDAVNRNTGETAMALKITDDISFMYNGVNYEMGDYIIIEYDGNKASGMYTCKNENFAACYMVNNN